MAIVAQLLNVFCRVVQMISILMVQLRDPKPTGHFAPIHKTDEAQPAIHIITPVFFKCKHTWTGASMPVACSTHGTEPFAICCTRTTASQINAYGHYISHRSLGSMQVPEDDDHPALEHPIDPVVQALE